MLLHAVQKLTGGRFSANPPHQLCSIRRELARGIWFALAVAMTPLNHRICGLAILTSSFLSSACSSSDAAPSPTLPAQDAATPDATTGNSAQCPDGTARVDDACAAELAVATSPIALTPARDHHIAFTRVVGADTYLYVVGGTAGWDVMFSDIQRAKLEADGSLSAFETAGTMPEGRAGHAFLVAGNTLTVFGGIIGKSKPSGLAKSSYQATFATDGTLGSFSPGQDLPDAMMHGAHAMLGEYVYVFGGRGAKGSMTTVAVAKVNADGTVGAFSRLAPLAVDRSHMGYYQFNDWIYLFGGITGSPEDSPPARTDIVRAQMLPGGQIGPWLPAGEIGRGVAITAATKIGDYFYLFGGLTERDSGKSQTYTNEVFRARLLPDGSVGAFSPLTTKLSKRRGHVHQLPVFGNHIYSIGGLTLAGQSLGTVDIATFTSPLP
jgi:hypothetical protein